MTVAGLAGHVGEWVLILLVLLGAVPLLSGVYQFLLVGLHRFHSHYDQVEPYLPRVAVVVPAWNEAAVLPPAIDRLCALDYPPERLRVYVVDDASTDATPDVVAAKAREYPGQVVHLRRDRGGEGKAHTLNHGLAVVLSDDWAQAVLIMDADVVYEATSLRRMTRHLADPRVGAVTAYIKEGSSPTNALKRSIGYEYVAAQAAARRSQNVLGVMACLAGGAQLHARSNLDGLGGRIDTTSLAEDTITTFETQRAGRRVVFDGNAVVWAEEPGSVAALWKQRLRWARGNVQVTRRYRKLWFHPSRAHGLGGWGFGLYWFTLLLLPAFMVASSASLVVLFLIESETAFAGFRLLWILNAVGYVFLTAFGLLVDTGTGRRVWREAILFPGVVSLAIIVYTCFPRWGAEVGHDALGLVDGSWRGRVREGVLLFAYCWVAGCMVVAWLAKVCDGGRLRFLSPLLIGVSGYGPLLCAITLASYRKEFRGAEAVWDKTEKTGTVKVPV